MATTEALSSDWIWEADLEYRLTHSNQAVRAFLGYDPSTMLGDTLARFVAPDVLPDMEARVEQSVHERGTPVLDGPIEVPWIHADGHTVMLQGMTSAIHDENGVVVGYRGTRRIMTDAMVAARTVAAGAGRVRRVLDDRAFDVALQPIINLTTGRLAGVEALARFRDGRATDVWFQEAREAGMGLELDRLTFMTALDLMPSLPAPCELSINATPELISDTEFQQLLRKGDLDYERIIIEITEHVRISSYEDVAASLAPLRERGIRLAVDDTGAGFASLTHVLQLRPDIIKIDRSLVSHVTSDAARRSVITSLVLLALDLGASVTAEGVETPSELETLATMGADHVQGYLLARPTPGQFTVLDLRALVGGGVFAMIAPMYKGGVVPATLAERRRLIVGWMSAMIDSSKFLGVALTDHPGFGVNLVRQDLTGAQLNNTLTRAAALTSIPDAAGLSRAGAAAFAALGKGVPSQGALRGAQLLRSEVSLGPDGVWAVEVRGTPRGAGWSAQTQGLGVFGGGLVATAGRASCSRDLSTRARGSGCSTEREVRARSRCSGRSMRLASR
jgi:PAS domain S-box-containing protein